jgi:hypothetical protein
MQKLKPFSALVGIAVVFGIFSAYADGWYGNYWQGDQPFVISLLLLAAGVVGNAAGIWALCAVGASYYMQRRFGFWYGIAAAGIFLLAAITSYYLAIAFGSLRPESDLLPTFVRWLVVAGIISVPSGLAGGWLANNSGIPRRTLATVIILGYFALDMLLLYHAAAEVDLAVAVLAIIYALGIGLLLFRAIHTQRLKIFTASLAILVVITGAGLLLWPAISSALIRVQHGEPQQFDDGNTIYVN